MKVFVFILGAVLVIAVFFLLADKFVAETQSEVLDEATARLQAQLSGGEIQRDFLTGLIRSLSPDTPISSSVGS